MRNIVFFFLGILAMSCGKPNDHSEQGDFLNMENTKTPELLMPGLIASPFDEYNGTFPPDGKEFYYTTSTPNKGIITFTKLNPNGVWETPKIAPFSGIFSEYDPIFSPKGDRIYFTSERPTVANGESGKTNIWYVQRESTSWSEPHQVNLEQSGAYYSSLTNKGDIYFNIWDTGDMYKATEKSNQYEVTKLDSILNTPNGEGDPFISPTEDYLIFRGYNNSFGQGDLYISFNLKGHWTAPENLGEPINSPAHEMCPFVTTDGKYFIFASNRVHEEYESSPSKNISTIVDKYKSHDNGNLNIYYVSAEFISEMKEKYL